MRTTKSLFEFVGFHKSRQKPLRSSKIQGEPLETRRFLAADIGQPVSEFVLDDVNLTSARYGESVAPSDYQDSVSAWYFGHAT